MMDFFAQIPVWVAIAALAAGALLVLLECFLPGLGAPGIAGGCLLVLSVLMLYPHIGSYVILVALGVAAFIAVAITVFARRASEGKSKLVLSAAARREDGFTSVPEEGALLGRTGVTASFLRPSGIAEIDGKRLDVVTNGEFLEKGTQVEVCAVEGRRIVVKKL